jgi:hypothetical protein
VYVNSGVTQEQRTINMPTLSEEGRERLNEIARRHGVSFAAVDHLLMALISGHGTQAQFNHPDIGGMGQWSQGGMTMVGDMFNNGLKAQVDSLCSELANLLHTTGFHGATQNGQFQSQSNGYSQSSNWPGSITAGVSLFVPGSASSANWWPEDIGYPASTGAQNNLRYAFFPASRRLAIDVGGRVTVYDTKDHQIGGFSQQQGGDQSLTFTSQYGLVRVADLDRVSGADTTPAEAPPHATPEAPFAAVEATIPFSDSAQHQTAPAPAMGGQYQPEAQRSVVSTDDEIFAKIEKLAALHDRGILTDKEYQDKKADLLSRL